MKFIGKPETDGDVTSVVAGVGLSGGATDGDATLTVDFSEFSTVTPVHGDMLATLDADGSTEQLTNIRDLATLFAGSGLTATNSVIAVDTLNQNTTGSAAGLSATLEVDSGGTGATSLTNGGVLLGSGSGAITATSVLGDGVMIVGDGSTDPALESGATLRTSIGVLNVMHYQFLGYSIGDGTNYEMAQNLTDNQAPFEHADTSSSDGLTIPAGSVSNVSEMIRMGGHVMPRAGTLKNWKGWTSCNDASGDHFVALFKWSPVENNDTDISASHGGLTMLVTATQAHTTGGNYNDRVRALSITSGWNDDSVAAGDIIFTQVKTSNGSKTVYFNTTLEIELTV